VNFLLATVIDGGALWKTALAALAAGAGLTLLFSLAILGVTRGADLRAEGRELASTAAYAFGVLALVLSVAGVAVGLIVMINE